MSAGAPAVLLLLLLLGWLPRSDACQAGHQRLGLRGVCQRQRQDIQLL
jgi:hypothetical protein